MDHKPHISEEKKKIISEALRYFKEYPIIGLVDMENLPAPQLQAMKSKLRDSVKLFMTKKRLMRIIFKEVEKDKKGITELEKYFKGMPALLFTKDSPFKLSKTLQKNKSTAPAKAGQEAPNDIMIPKGPTSFAPGPIISELGSIGLKTGVENGKVAVKEDSVVAKTGDKISPKLAEVLTRMGIEPMEVGLDLTAAYEEGIIYDKDILTVDDQEYLDKLSKASSESFNLAIFIDYPAKETIELLIGKAFNEAKAIGLSQNIIEEGILDELLTKAERSMLNVKNTANIKVAEKPKKEAPAEDKKKDQKAEEKKPEEVKEEPKAEEKKASEKPAEVPKEEHKAEEKKEESKTEEKKEEPKAEENKPESAEKKPVEETKREEVKIDIPDKEAVQEKKEEIIEKEKEILDEEKNLEKAAENIQRSDAPKETKEAAKNVKEVIEKELEEEKAVVEEKLEKVEAAKKDVDDKVKDMVEETKKFVKGKKGPTPEDILDEIEEESEDKKPEPKKEEQKVEEKPKEKKEERKVAEEKKEPKEEKSKDPIPKESKEVPSAHDLAKKKAEKEQKEVEELAKKLSMKGTLRRK